MDEMLCTLLQPSSRRKNNIIQVSWSKNKNNPMFLHFLKVNVVAKKISRHIFTVMRVNTCNLGTATLGLLWNYVMKYLINERPSCTVCVVLLCFAFYDIFGVELIVSLCRSDNIDCWILNIDFNVDYEINVVSGSIMLSIAMLKS